VSCEPHESSPLRRTEILMKVRKRDREEDERAKRDKSERDRRRQEEQAVPMEDPQSGTSNVIENP
jgi:hypothetical protein